MRAVDYAIVEAKKEEDVEMFAIHVVFIRQDYSLNFLAELGGGHVHTRIPEKIEKEIQGWFDIIKEKTDQNKLELRTDIVVGSKPVAWVVVDYAKGTKCSKSKNHWMHYTYVQQFELNDVPIPNQRRLITTLMTLFNLIKQL